MLPIALTCPLWWVARWTARMLASLAVVAACSLGAATLPVGVAAHAASGPVDTSTVRAGSPDLALALGSARRVTGSSEAVTGAAARAGAGAADRDVTAAADRQAGPVTAAPVPTGVAPVERHRVPVGQVPTTVGSRAPPAR